MGGCRRSRAEEEEHDRSKVDQKYWVADRLNR